MPAKSLRHNETARYVGHFFSADHHFHSTDAFFDLDGNDIVDVADLDWRTQNWRTTSRDANVDRAFGTAGLVVVFAAHSQTLGHFHGSYSHSQTEVSKSQGEMVSAESDMQPTPWPTFPWIFE